MAIPVARPATIVMHRLPMLALMFTGLVANYEATAQLFTMSKDCREKVATAQDFNSSRNFPQARDLFANIAEECDTKDGIEAVQVGLAHAYNGLRDYDAAIVAANLALESSKQTSIDALFERALAEEAMGNPAAAQADYEQVIQLTEMNQNVSERATIYAKVADLNYRTGNRDVANDYLARAMDLDPDNADLYAQRGDWEAVDGNYDAAFADLDAAIAHRSDDADLYALRSDTRIRMMQEKYSTENVQELRSRMSAAETDQVCADSKAALDHGLRDMQLDMFVAMVCR